MNVLHVLLSIKYSIVNDNLNSYHEKLFTGIFTACSAVPHNMGVIS